MLCVTGAENGPAGLRERVRRCPDADLYEVRLDHFTDLSPEQLGVLPERDRLLVTLRHASEGGAYHGSREAQTRLLGAALRAGARYVDLEAAAPPELWTALSAEFGPDRLVASAHGADLVDLAAQAEAVAGTPAGRLKLAAPVSDVTELDELRRLLASDPRPTVRIGMGLAGQLSRVQYARFGSPWTYVFDDAGVSTAPGQVSYAQMRTWARRRADRLLVLLGGPQVVHSPGPRVYEGVAARGGQPYHYLAVPTARPLVALERLAEFGLRGASVTMPHKRAVMAAVQELDPFAKRVGAVNTLVPCDGGGWRGLNTDGVGVVGALTAAGAAPHRGGQVLLLGAGGAARAAAVALVDAGYRVVCAARRAAQAAELAAHIGDGVTPAPWDEVERVEAHIVVNSTPVGADGQSSPVRRTDRWQGCYVLDMLLHPSRTPLLKLAEAGGAIPVSGMAMWRHQGAAQWRHFTGERVAPDALRDPLGDNGE